MISNLNNTKTINYKGILSFNIPETWVEEYDNEGAVFYEDIPDSGTLRLKLISINIPKDQINIDAAQVLNNLGNKESKTIKLPNKNAYNMFYEHTVEDDIEITIFYWSLVQAVKANKTRLANFSYTIFTDQVDSEFIKQEITFITKQIENTSFNTIY